MTLGEKIFILRRENGLSQEELAERLGVSRQSVSKWESGNVMPDLDKVLMLSEIFSVSTDTLVKDNIGIISDGAEDEQDAFEDISSFSGAPVSEYGSEFDTGELPAAALTVKEDEQAAAQSEIPQEAPAAEKRKYRRALPAYLKIVISLVVCAALISAAVVPYFTGGYDRLAAMIFGGTDYPYVLVHGMGGWGSGSKINEVAPYWGADSGSLSEYLNKQGNSVYEANVGPFSSCWDRACELYAELTGTQVDYGEVHSKQHSHSRFGRKYEKPLVPSWGEEDENGRTVKINLVGHSFGGNTVRLFTHLLEYGAPEEVAETDETTSGLFTGGKGKLVNSVTTLCSPHNGSTLYYISEDYGLTSYALGLCFSIAGLSQNTSFQKFYDFHLEQFGLKDAGANSANLNAVAKVISSSDDNAIYDLSPDGAQKLNERITLVKNVYYFSYSYCTTEKSTRSDAQVPISSTLPVLKATALLIGNYSVNKQTDFPIDKTWLENDGLVNVVSAKYPFGDAFTDFDENRIRPGVWNVMPTIVGDHGTAIGMNRSAELTHEFYDNLIEMINALPTRGGR